MARENLQTCGGLVEERQIHQTDDSRMGQASDDCQLPEIFIERHKHSFLLVSLCKYFLVPGVQRPIPDPGHVVSCHSKLDFHQV